MNEHADIVVIGSGAAGSVMAYCLAKRGLKVIVLEKGAREDPATFEHDELEMLPRLYKAGGLQMTKDHDVAIAQGCAVGGSTVINNAITLPVVEGALETAEVDRELVGKLDFKIHDLIALQAQDEQLINSRLAFADAIRNHNVPETETQHEVTEEMLDIVEAAAAE